MKTYQVKTKHGSFEVYASNLYTASLIAKTSLYEGEVVLSITERLF